MSTQAPSVLEIAPLLLKVKYFIDTNISDTNFQTEFNTLKSNEARIYQEQIKNMDNFLTLLDECEETMKGILRDNSDRDYVKATLKNKHYMLVNIIKKIHNLFA